FELALDGANIDNLLSINGGNIVITFPTASGDYPVLSNLTISPDEFRLFRSGSNNTGLSLTSPVPDRYFRNTSELSDPKNAVALKNADVVGRTGLSQSFAYVSMYIVAEGINPTAFTPIYSKPTHICVFKLP
ncbi:hypothetical protein, partial [Treponema sp. R6D11]